MARPECRNFEFSTAKYCALATLINGGYSRGIFDVSKSVTLIPRSVRPWEPSEPIIAEQFAFSATASTEKLARIATPVPDAFVAIKYLYGKTKQNVG